MKQGDIVKITKGDRHYFNTGDFAVLGVGSDSGGWWADFTINKKYYMDGIWSLQDGFCEYELIWRW